MKKDNVLIVAVGGIGFRHFQALLNCQSDFDLHVVDVDYEAIERARAYAEEQAHGRTVYYYASVNEIIPSMHFEVAIIATSSLVRRTVFEELIARCTVRTVIFEKFLFPCLNDYSEVGNRLRQKNIAAYVNCARRVQNLYLELRQELHHAKWLHVQVRGSNWGLACNGIHMVDLAAWLSPGGVEPITCNGALLENKIYDSKRKGYIEFYGKLTGRIGENTTYLLECDHGQAEGLIELFTDTSYYSINESEGSMIAQSINSGDPVVRKFELSFVSQTSTQIIDRLLRGHPIELTSYEDSARLHVPVLQEFLKKQNIIQGSESEICPIT